MYKYIVWAVVIIWMSLIFYLSHQPATASNELSGAISEVIVTTIEKVVPFINFESENLDFIVRKSAHFLAYLTLGLLVLNAFKSVGYRGMGLTLLICVLYAISDEVHQIFIPGRSGEIRDVLIDSLGASVGIGVVWLIGRFIRKRYS